MDNTNYIYNSVNNSIFHSSIISKNKINSKVYYIKSKSFKHKHKQGLSPISKVKKIFFKKLEKQKQKEEGEEESPNENNNHISYESTNIHSNNDTNKNKLKNIIKYNKPNNNEIINYMNFSYDNISPLTENRTFYLLSFNGQLSKYLNQNNSKFYNKQSLLTFREKNNIHRKICYLNNFCKSIFKGYKKNDYFENMYKNIDKSDEIFDKYKYDISSYLYFLKQQIKKEENILDKIIAKRLNLKAIINKLYNLIAKNRFIIDECKDIKEFLLKVKYGVADIDDLPKNIINLYEHKVSDKTNIPIITNISSNKNVRARKKTNLIKFPNLIVKNLVKIPNPNKENINNIDNKNNISKKINDNLYLTPIRSNTKMNTKINIKLNEQDKVNRKISFRRSLVSKFSTKNLVNKNLIFDDPEEFMNRYEELVFKMKKSLEYYNEILYQIQILKNTERIGNDYLMDEKLEKKCKILLNRLHFENSILNKKLKIYAKLNNEAGLEEKITEKIKNILLEINSATNIEKKFNIFQFELRLEKYETNNLQTKAEKNKTKNAFLMETLENILEKLISIDKSYKNNPIYKDRYKKIKAIEENIKFKKIREIQLNKIKKKENEKNKRIIENYTKIRFLSLSKKGMNLYHIKNNNSKKDMLKTQNLSSFNQNFYLNPLLSLSFDKNNNNKIIENNKTIKKKDNIIKEIREEMVNLLSY